jgi:putative membrane protein
MMRGYGWYGGGMGWAGWLVMASMMVVFWGVVIAAVVWLVHYSGHHHDERSSDANGSEQALRVLDERLARGDIDAEEYTQRRDLLRAR